MSTSTAVKAVLARDRVIVLAGLACVVAFGWVYLLYLAQGMSGMAMGDAMGAAKAEPWTAGDFTAMVVMWAVMMVAMMLPSAAPMILMFSTISRKHRADGRHFPPVGIFALGYVLAWTGFSLAATLLQWGLQSLALMSPMMKTTSPVIGGALFAVAGIYQFTPLKHVCLRHCRSPLGFLLTRWRDGHRGALIMGFEHGAFCLGCCWALMIVLFAVGVMNLFWVAAIAVFVLIEKLVPGGETVARMAGICLIAAGACLAFGVLPV
ncbi:MAG: DUF2182 domain-containing protein [Hyphomicrobiales bacterium]